MYVVVEKIRGGFNGRPLVQWPMGPLALEAPGARAWGPAGEQWKLH